MRLELSRGFIKENNVTLILGEILAKILFCGRDPYKVVTWILRR